MNSPIIRSAPDSSAGRPDAVTPKVTSSLREVLGEHQGPAGVDQRGHSDPERAGPFGEGRALVVREAQRERPGAWLAAADIVHRQRPDLRPVGELGGPVPAIGLGIASVQPVQVVAEGPNRHRLR